MVARQPREASATAPRIGEDRGRVALLVDGVVQSVAVRSLDRPDGYWWEMLPDVRPQRALLLGLGGGTVAQLLRQRFGDVAMVGVESDALVLELAKSTLLSDVEMEFCHADAHEFLGTAESGFDYVCVDLFQGERVDRRISGRPFLRQIERVVNRGGTVCFNMFLDKRTVSTVARIGRVLRVTREVRCGKNVVVHTRVT
jgi:spermidine synthase